MYDEFVRKVTQKVSDLRHGHAEGPGSVDVGAMTFPPQLDVVEKHVTDAVAKGAKVLVGGKRREGQGLFFEPTVLTDVDHTMDAMTEETFGPTLPIMKVKDAEGRSGSPTTRTPACRPPSSRRTSPRARPSRAVSTAAR